MKKYLIVVLEIFLIACSGGDDISVDLIEGPDDLLEGYRIIFKDDFSQNSLNRGNWNTSLWWGRSNLGNLEAQWYIDNAFSVNNGILSIIASRSQDLVLSNDFDYTSGVITTHQKTSFTYGKVIVRAKVPKGQGLWPALWLLPSSQGWPPEIDLMETIGGSVVYFTYHWGSNKDSHEQENTSIFVQNLTDDFHVYELDWEENQIIWSFDGVEVFRTSENVPQEEMYFIANLAVGGKWPGYPDSTTVFPSRFDIDYVKIYQRE